MTTRRLPGRVGEGGDARRPRRQIPARQRDLVPTVTGGLAPTVTGCTRRIDLPTFRALLGFPTWSLVTQFLVTGRWYEAGLDLAFELLACADRYQPALSAEEEADARTALYLLVLDMLDRLDAWETYLDVFQRLREGTTYSLSYRGGAATYARAQPYVLRQEGETTELHFLWLIDHRKQLIARKRAKHRAGRRVGNLRHHPQSALSDAELRRRLAWVAELARTLRWSGTGPPPGAPADRSAPPPRADAVGRWEPAGRRVIGVESFLQEWLAGGPGRDDAAHPPGPCRHRVRRLLPASRG